MICSFAAAVTKSQGEGSLVAGKGGESNPRHYGGLSHYWLIFYRENSSLSRRNQSENQSTNYNWKFLLLRQGSLWLGAVTFDRINFRLMAPTTLTIKTPLSFLKHSENYKRCNIWRLTYCNGRTKVNCFKILLRLKSFNLALWWDSNQESSCSIQTCQTLDLSFLWMSFHSNVVAAKSHGSFKIFFHCEQRPSSRHHDKDRSTQLVPLSNDLNPRSKVHFQL